MSAAEARRCLTLPVRRGQSPAACAGRRALLDLVALVGATAIAVLALARGEPVNAVWFVIAAVRFTPSPTAFTPRSSPRACSLDDAADAGGAARQRTRLRPDHPLDHLRASLRRDRRSGPAGRPDSRRAVRLLAATLWIVIGAVLGGACRTSDPLGCLRRDGRSLGQMAPDEIGPVGGFTALVGVLRSW